MNPNLFKALAEMEDGDNRPGVKEISVSDIQEWAVDSGLPVPSARAFAAWLSENFYEWNEDGELTNGQVLKDARAYWTGKG